MIEYKLCTEVPEEQIYQAAMSGFCDYIIPFNMEADFFSSHFWGPEGNKKEWSFIALDEGKPIGLVLGGIRIFDGRKTMRCGMLGIAPEYRGHGIAHKLMDLHKQTAVDEGCRQLFLEVIKGNDRAVKFYANLGYVKVYDIRYFSLKKSRLLCQPSPISSGVEKSSFREIAAYRSTLTDVHLHWQREVESFHTADTEYRVIRHEGEIAATIAFSSKVIYFLYVGQQFREKGYARALLNNAVESFPDDKLFTLSFTNNALLETFCIHLEAERNKIAQYEMYLRL